MRGGVTEPVTGSREGSIRTRSHRPPGPNPGRASPPEQFAAGVATVWFVSTVDPSPTRARGRGRPEPAGGTRGGPRRSRYSPCPSTRSFQAEPPGPLLSPPRTRAGTNICSLPARSSSEPAGRVSSSSNPPRPPSRPLSSEAAFAREPSLRDIERTGSTLRSSKTSWKGWASRVPPSSTANPVRGTGCAPLSGHASWPPSSVSPRTRHRGCDASVAAADQNSPRHILCRGNPHRGLLVEPLSGSGGL